MFSPQSSLFCGWCSKCLLGLPTSANVIKSLAAAALSEDKNLVLNTHKPGSSKLSLIAGPVEPDTSGLCEDLNSQTLVVPGPPCLRMFLHWDTVPSQSYVVPRLPSPRIHFHKNRNLHPCLQSHNAYSYIHLHLIKNNKNYFFKEKSLQSHSQRLIQSR